MRTVAEKGHPILPPYADFHPAILRSFHSSILLYFRSTISVSWHVCACALCSVKLMASFVSPALSRGLGRDDLIRQYFFEGYDYHLIICFLFFIHGITLSLRQLKRILRRMNLSRRMLPSSRRTVSLLIQVAKYGNLFLCPSCRIIIIL